jgi:glyoxylase-like metal-dependent hydrolase (beta-lactamase superfamily II)
MQINTINTGLFKLDGGAMFGVVPKSMWHKRYPADDNNMCTWAMRCMLVQDAERLILIDTGIGNKQDDKFFGHYFLHGNDSLINSVQQLGHSADEITDVVLTHLHFDHCGGAIVRTGELLVPQFKNAQYWSNETHWQNATAPNEREQASFLTDNILPIQQSGQLQFVSTDSGTLLAPFMEMITVHGHTEGMMLPLISYKGHKILYAADLFPSPHHISLPWIMAYDMQPLHTLAEKKAILKRAAQEQWLVYFEHDAQVEMCRLEATEKGVKAGEILTLRDL